ncbi:MAG: hypothetical protein CL608_27680 [Anaerolineaceae bacterium]|nr:hypothetical protein [Anaerolineaceae bacterium]
MSRLKQLLQSPWVQVTLYLLLIAALTYLFLWRLWAAAPEDRAYLPEKSDLAEVFYPPRYFFAKTLAGGEFALWNPHVYAGYPQFADPQAATFYPIALLLAWIAKTNFSLATLAFDIGLHFFLAGAFSFLFIRHLFKANLPALLSAVLFEFGGYLTFYPPGQLSELEVVAWFPLTLLLVTLAIERRSWLLTAVAGGTLGMVFLAGRPQSYLTIGSVTVAWLVYTAYRDKMPWTRIAKKLLLLAGFALGIAAAQWLPTLELTRLTTRSILTYDLVAEGGFPFVHLTGFFVPQLLGTQNLYVGLMALVLATLAVQQRKGMFWTAVFLIALFGSVGKHLIIFDGLYLIEQLGFPGYLRNVERLAFAMTFSLAALSGYGIMLVQQIDRQLLRRYLMIAAGIFATAVVLTWLWTISREPGGDRFLPVDTLTYVVLMLGGGALALWVFRESPRVAVLALVLIAVVDVMSLNQGRFFVERADSFAPGNDVARVMAAPEGIRPFYRTVFDQTTSQDFGSLAGVDNVGGMPPLMLIDYELLRETLDEEYRRNIILNVDMVVTTGDYSDPAYELVKEEDNFRYYRFLHALPRAYLVPNIVEVPDAATAAERLAVPDFEYGTTALVVGETGLASTGELAEGETAVVLHRTANSVTLQVTANQPRFLVYSGTHYPGWQAEIDGQPTEIYKTNVALRGIVVPPGSHTVTMTFRPIIFYAGVGVSLGTAVILLLWLGLIGANRLRKRPRNSA